MNNLQPAGSSQTQRLAYSVREAAQSLGVSARTIVREIQRGRLSAIRVGRRVLIPAQSLAEFLNCRAPEGVVPAREERIERSCGAMQ
jgi:excisionase family DNA binding protein